jgi:hypothetical protein
MARPITRARALPRTGLRKILLLAFLSCSPVALAQDEAAKLDPETKARVRTEGSAGGIPGGLKTDSQKEGDVSEGASSKATAKKGRVADETSSDREEARGARGNAQQETPSAGANAPVEENK